MTLREERGKEMENKMCDRIGSRKVKYYYKRFSHDTYCTNKICSNFQASIHACTSVMKPVLFSIILLVVRPLSKHGTTMRIPFIRGSKHIIRDIILAFSPDFTNVFARIQEIDKKKRKIKTRQWFKKDTTKKLRRLTKPTRSKKEKKMKKRK